MSSHFVEPLLALKETAGVQVFVEEDQQTGSHLVVVCPRAQKVVVKVYNTIEATEVLTQRVEPQHTMNALSMQAIDMTEPFNSVEVLTRDTRNATKELFEDNLQVIYDAHRKLSTNGYRLWKSDILMQSNVVAVRGIYIRSEQLDPNVRTSQMMESVTLEGYVTAAELKNCFETSRNPSLYWDYTVDQNYARIDKAHRFDSLNGHKRDMYIKVKPTETLANLPGIDTVPSLAIMDAWNVKRVTGKHQTSLPGRIDTNRVFRCVDHYDNAFTLQITYNL